jgi:trehalose 2-sulfotransferase
VTRFSAQDELPQAAHLMPSDLVAGRVEPLDASWSAPECDDSAKSSNDCQPGQHLRLVAVAPPTQSTAQDAHVAPTASVFICHTMRCGSTLLCDGLSNTGVVGHAEEYFPERARDGTVFVSAGAALKDPDTWRCDWTSTPFEQCLERVLSTGTTPNGVFAAKVKWPNMGHLAELMDGLLEGDRQSPAEHLDSLFPNLRYVWVTRRDKVRQAVSLVKARQSTQWKEMTAQPQRSHAADYNFLLVDLALRQIIQEECSWEDYFARTGITPFTVIYEDFVRNYEATVRQLLEHLQIDLPRDYAFPHPRLRKQADAESEEWVERYYRDAQSSRTWRTVASLPAFLLRRRLRQTYVVPRLRRRIGRLRTTRPRANAR